MKPNFAHLEQFRLTQGPMQSTEGERHGAFFVGRGKVQFVIIATSGDPEIPWEHVSARARTNQVERVPTWEEMCWLKSLFWDPEECVVQFHPPESQYVNYHPHVLHLWRHATQEFLQPPSVAIGPR